MPSEGDMQRRIEPDERQQQFWMNYLVLIEDEQKVVVQRYRELEAMKKGAAEQCAKWEGAA